jgi:transposase
MMEFATHHVATGSDTRFSHGRPGVSGRASCYGKIIPVIAGFGPVTVTGVEGTGSYGAELARTLPREGIRFGS